MDVELTSRRVLIVEDEPHIAEIIDAFLAREGAQRLLARDGEDALTAAGYWRPDVVVLDLKLPKRDGYSVLSELRARQGPPVVILSALGEDVDKLMGFRLGCDDYLVKPFNPLELMARLKAVLRRSQENAANKALVVGDLRIDLDAHEVQCAGAPLPLTPTEFRILRFLAMRAGRLVTRGQIIEAAMGDEAFDKSVNPHISRLRQKLHDHSQRGVRLVSIRTEGYRLEASS
jgi:two-component system response regulator AdeR